MKMYRYVQPPLDYQSSFPMVLFSMEQYGQAFSMGCQSGPNTV